MARVLIVDDEKSIRNTVSEFLRMDGHEVQTAGDADAAGALMQAHTFDVVVTDIILPRVLGVTLLQRIKEQAPDIQVILMTGEPTVDTAVEAVRAGACDYLAKPIGKRDLLAVVGRAANIKVLLDEKHRLEADNRRYRENLEQMVEERTARLAARTRQVEAVREVAADMSREMDLPCVLNLIASRAMELVTGKSATVFLWDEEAQCLIPKAWPGYGEWRGAVRLRLGEGVAGSVAERRERLVLEDYRSSPYALPPIAESTDAGPVLAEPLLCHEGVLGVLVVDRALGARGFTAEDNEVLGLLARHAVIAIENARLYAESVTRREEVEVLASLARDISTSLDLDAILQKVTTGARALCHSDTARIALWDPTAGGLRFGYWEGMPCIDWSHVLVRPGQGVGGTVFATGRPFRTANYLADPRLPPDFRPLVQAEGVVAELAVPIGAEGRIVGVLYASNRSPRPFTDAEEVVLHRLADHAAIAIENARLYQQAEQHTAALETRVVARTAELAAANQELQAASQHKSEFLANMSHELRTPLNSILGFAQLLLEQTQDLLSVKQFRYLTHVRNSGQHLLQLINDILDISKVEAGKFVLQPEALQVGETLEDILVIARGLAHKKGQRIELTVAPNLPSLQADPVRFKQILFNLLSNAVKFTPEQGQITVTATQASAVGDAPTTDEGDAPWVEIAIRDTGIGIRTEDIPRLFQEFVQLETTEAQRHEGTGLGLALTKRLVELHGGRSMAASDGEGTGCTFTVVLPLAGPPTDGELAWNGSEPQTG